MNGLFPTKLKEASKFGKAYWDLVPLVHEFISISGSQKIFAPTIHSLEERAKEYCVKNPKPVKWRSKHNYEECILKFFKGMGLPGDFSGSLKDLKQQVKLHLSNGSTPIFNCVQQMFTYMAKDIFTNVKETTKRLSKKFMYGFVWNQVTGGQDIPQEQRGD